MLIRKVRQKGGLEYAMISSSDELIMKYINGSHCTPMDVSKLNSGRDM